MTRWWELAIPAASTLAGGWAGAWWQSRGTERQLAWQAREADETRLDAIRREVRDERTKAYVELALWIHELAAARGSYQQARDMASDAPPDVDVWKKQRDEYFEKYEAATKAARESLAAVEVLGSERQAELARAIRQEATALIVGSAKGYEQLESLREEFLEQARRERHDLEQAHSGPPDTDTERAKHTLTDSSG